MYNTAILGFISVFTVSEKSMTQCQAVRRINVMLILCSESMTRQTQAMIIMLKIRLDLSNEEIIVSFSNVVLYKLAKTYFKCIQNTDKGGEVIIREKNLKLQGVAAWCHKH